VILSLRGFLDDKVDQKTKPARLRRSHAVGQSDNTGKREIATPDFIGIAMTIT